MSVVKVALLQMAPFGTDQAANLAKGEAYYRLARDLGADIALFPEMWNIGYDDYDAASPEARMRWQRHALSRDSRFVRHFQALARELEMAIVITYLEAWPVAPRNTASLIDRHGEIVLDYAKVHTCDFGTECALTPGDDFYVAPLDTAAGEVQIGIMICYDREFPESARILMLKGAELILTPNACTLEAGRIGQFRARAFENMVGVAMTNYAAPKNNGHSAAFDAELYREIDGEPQDTLIVEAGTAEGIYMAEFDITRLRAYRERETWGNAYRKPYCYGILASTEVQPPFVRPDAKRRG